MIPVFRNRIAPSASDTVPHRGIKNTGIRRVHDQVDTAGFFIYIEDLLPGLATIHGLVYTTVFIIAPFISAGRYIDHFRMIWVNHYPRDGTGIHQTKMLEVLTSVGGFIDTHARQGSAENIGLARSYIDRILIRRCNSDTAHGKRGLLIK